jgi:hypothetical protein
MNQTIDGKREKLAKRIVELTKEEAKSFDRKNSSLKFNSRKKSVYEIDPDLLAFFPKSMKYRESEISMTDLSNPMKFNRGPSFNKSFNRQASVINPITSISIAPFEPANGALK